MPTITKIGYQVDYNSQVALQRIRENSKSLDSMRAKVLADADRCASIPGGRIPCYATGVSWDNPVENRNYRVHWIYMDGSKDTVIVDKIT